VQAVDEECGQDDRFLIFAIMDDRKADGPQG
jgi:hypothetical protein